MANNEEIGRSKVELDTTSAEAKIKSLDAKMQELKQTKRELEASNNLVGMGMVDREIKSTQKDLNQLRQSTKDYSTVLNNLSTASLRDMEAAYARLKKEVKGATRDTEDFNTKSAQLKTIGKEINSVKAQMSGVEQSSMFGRMADGINKYAGMIAVAAASFTGFALGVKGAIEASNEYEEKVANLSALTGLTGDKLKWLSDQAKEMSTSTVAGNIRITSSADDIVEAFTTVGSKRPELLGNKEALKQVTQEALILAEAGKMETVPSIEAVTAAMNQFNLGADQSKRIVNTLAAGSLAGSAEISDLAGSMKNVGTVAKDSNMSLEQTTAALEVLASKQILGEEAGTKLRGALLKMKEAGVGYASGQFNLADAIDEVNKKLATHTSAAEKDALKQKIFGAENITVGSILLQNKAAYEDLTKAVTGTNVAYEQAHVNTDIAKAKLAQAKNEFHNTTIEIGERLNPAMAKSVNIVNVLLKLIISAPEFIKKWAGTIISLTVVIVALTIAVNAQVIAAKAKIVWDAIIVFWNNVVKASFVQLWATMMANPIFAIIAGIVLLVGALVDLKRRSDEAAEAQRRHREEIEKTKKAIQDIIKTGMNIDKMDSTQIDAYIDELSKKVVLLRHYQTDAINKARQAPAGEQREVLGAQMKADTGFGYGESIAKVKELTALLAKARAHKRALLSKDDSNNNNDNKPDTSTQGKPAKAEKSPYDEALAGVSKAAEEQRLKAKDQRLNSLLDEKEYLEKLKAIDLSELESKRMVQESFNKDTLDTERQIADKKLQMRREYVDEYIRTEQQGYDQLELDARTDRVNGIISEKQYQAKILDIKIQRLKAEISMRKTAGLETIELEKKLADEELKIKEKAKADEISMLKQQSDNQANYYDFVNKNANETFAGIEFRSARQREAVDNDLKNGVISEEEAAKRRNEITMLEWQSKTDLVNQFQEQLSGIVDAAAQGQLKSFEEFGSQIFIMFLDLLEKEITATLTKSLFVATAGSLASPESIASYGLLGAIKAAGLAVLIKGAFAVAKSELKSKMSDGFAEGGYTTPGPKYKPAGIVHAGEWVASQKLLKNPIAAAMVSQLDNFQKHGYVQGGYVTPISQAPSSDLELKQMLMANIQTLSQLSKKVDNMKAYISYSHLKETTDKMNQIQSSRKTS
jgi:TP901 family phage tail tape measure protein